MNVLIDYVLKRKHCHAISRTSSLTLACAGNVCTCTVRVYSLFVFFLFVIIISALIFLFLGRDIVVMLFCWQRMKRSSFCCTSCLSLPVTSTAFQPPSLIQVISDYLTFILVNLLSISFPLSFFSFPSFSSLLLFFFLSLLLLLPAMSYRVLVVSEGKYLGLSSACLYVNVGGEGGESGTVAIPRGNYQVEFSVS